MADFSIGSFNVLNFHDIGGLVYGEPAYTPTTYDRKAGWIGRQIQSMNAEIIGFQEVWSLAALQDAAQRSGRFQANQVHMFDPGPNPTEPNVALATSLPIVGQIEYHTQFPAGLNFGVLSGVTEFERPVLHAQVELRPGTIGHVFVAHLKSKRPTFDKNSTEDQDDPKVKALGYARSLLRRAAEAAALRWIIIDIAQNTQIPVVVMGDLNDGVDAVSTRILMGDRPFGGNAAAAYDILLYSTYELQSERSLRDVYYTHIYNSQFETLDHVLVSEELAGRGPKALAELQELEMWNDHLNNSDKTRSDHGQIVARFRWKK